MKSFTAIIMTSVICALSMTVQAHPATNAERFAVGLPPLAPEGMRMKRGSMTVGAARVRQRRQNGPSALPAPARATALPADDDSTKMGFYDTCVASSISTDGTQFTSTCTEYAEADTSRTTTLNLNNCLGNNNGQFGPGGTNAFQTCNLCTLNDSTLKCACQAGDGGNSVATIDLNTLVGNNDGTLQCYQYFGTPAVATTH